MFSFVKNIFGSGKKDKNERDIEEINEAIQKTKNKQSKFEIGFGTVSSLSQNRDLEKRYDSNQENKQRMKEKMLVQKTQKIGAATPGMMSDQDEAIRTKLLKQEKIIDQQQEYYLTTQACNDELNKVLGPNEKKIRKSMNKKLRKKYKEAQRQEQKKLLNRIGENEQKVYDFIYDFSSSDYDSISEGDLENINEYDAINEQNLMNKMNELANSPGQSMKKKKFDPLDVNQSMESKTVVLNQGDKAFHLRRLLDSYKKFEKRKVLRPQPYYQNSRISIQITKPHLTEEFNDIMVFESLDLKQKMKLIFHTTKIAQEEESDSETGRNLTQDGEKTTRAKQLVPLQVPTKTPLPQTFSAQVQQQAVTLKSHVSNKSVSDVSDGNTEKDDATNRGYMTRKTKVSEKKSMNRGETMSHMSGGQQEQYQTVKKPSKEQLRLEELKKDIQIKMDKIEKIEKDEQDKKQKYTSTIMIKELEELPQKMTMKEIDDIKILKNTINRKLNLIEGGIQNIGMTHDDIKDEQWLLHIKTHIGKFQSQIIAFSIKRYFKKWKQINEDYKSNLLETNQQQNAQELELKKKNGFFRGEGDGGEKEEENIVVLKRQYDVFLPSEKLKKKLIPHCYNIYKPTPQEK